ncbi:MAG: hypothetical protein JXA91_03540 [Candidatus Thermoplasmatota archaeon]|nr:hypothetical protein [Candidatus Thermoplasmatota archaeon]
MKINNLISKFCKNFLIEKIPSVFVLLSLISTSIILTDPRLNIADAGNIENDIDTSTYFSVKIPGEWEPDEPGEPGGPVIESPLRIVWYDLQNSSGFSVLNKNIDVNEEYKFCVSIYAEYGWETIEYINITAWYDRGSEITTYNASNNLGGNLNIFLQYQNTTGIAQFKRLWPHDELITTDFTDIPNDPVHRIGSEKSHTVTFSFVPGYQIRYAPGDGNWDCTKNKVNDIWSWNFEISVTDNGKNAGGSRSVYVVDEFGISSYQEVVCTGTPSIHGIPGENASADKNISIITRSNVDFLLLIDVTTFYHESYSDSFFSNNSIWIRGGGLSKFENFNGFEPVYLFGSRSSFIDSDDSNIIKKTDNVQFKCDIPMAVMPGNYTATVNYKLKAKL